MKFKGMKKIHEGHFIHRYDIEYEAADGSSKVYEMITRNRNMQTLEDLQNVNPDSVIMILTDENNEPPMEQIKFRVKDKSTYCPTWI